MKMFSSNNKEISIRSTYVEVLQFHTFSQNKMSSKLTKKIVILQNNSAVDYYEAFAEDHYRYVCVYIPALIWIQWLDMRSPSSVFSSPPPSNVCSHLRSLEWMSFWNDFSGKACHKSVLPPSNNSKTRKTGLTTEPLSQYFHSVFTFCEQKNGV